MKNETNRLAIKLNLNRYIDNCFNAYVFVRNADRKSNNWGDVIER